MKYSYRDGNKSACVCVCVCVHSCKCMKGRIHAWKQEKLAEGISARHNLKEDILPIKDIPDFIIVLRVGGIHAMAKSKKQSHAAYINWITCHAGNNALIIVRKRMRCRNTAYDSNMNSSAHSKYKYKTCSNQYQHNHIYGRKFLYCCT